MHETETQPETSGSHTTELYRVIDREMSVVREKLSAELSDSDELTGVLCRHVARYQGKMLRPAILLLSGKACGELMWKHFNFAVVIELLHLATLIHDDVLDNAEVRRQSSTANRLWGNEASVLLGDYLLSKAFDLSNRTASPAESSELSSHAKIICQGELLQCLTHNDWTITEDRYLQIIEMKTARLYQLCCRLGASLSGAESDEQAGLEEYGRLLGRCFQITDDLLDILGDEGTVGKTLGTDLRQAKPTLPVIHFCRTAGLESREELIALLTQGPGARSRFRDLLERSGSLDYAWKLTQEYMDQARAQLRVLRASPAREALSSIAEFVVKRTC